MQKVMFPLAASLCIFAGTATAQTAPSIKPSAPPAVSETVIGTIPAQRQLPGPAYQFEGKWKAILQNAGTGTEIETIANCVSPIVLTARDASTLVREDGKLITLAVIDKSTIAWMENNSTTIVTPEREGNFMAMIPVGATNRLQAGRVISYLRCGTAGETASSQICVAK
jgi:hypothetical protein